jgi:hypothetical protein
LVHLLDESESLRKVDKFLLSGEKQAAGIENVNAGLVMTIKQFNASRVQSDDRVSERGKQEVLLRTGQEQRITHFDPSDRESSLPYQASAVANAAK